MPDNCECFSTNNLFDGQTAKIDYGRRANGEGGAESGRRKTGMQRGRAEGAEERVRRTEAAGERGDAEGGYG